MKAYAIFDGGGVLGAALAGALKAAERNRVEFIGFGGTSAGSIVATLAAVGYTGEELEHILVDTEFTRFLNDGGMHVDAFKSRIADVISNLQKGGLRALWGFYRLSSIEKALRSKFGIDDGQSLKVFLLERIREKLPDLDGVVDVTFADLGARESANGPGPPCRPLKIVASDITRRMPVVFSRDHTGYGNSVLDAVRASTCYPFVFQPVDRNRQCWLVDGGLASNLPAFLFHEEQQRTRYPVFAFDLIAEAPNVGSGYDLKRFLKDMASTALDAGDELLRQVLKDVIHVPIRIPDQFDVLDFRVDKKGRRTLFEIGYNQTRDFLDDLEILDRANRAEDFVEQLREHGLAETEIRERVLQKQMQARYGDPKLFETVLSAVARDVESHTSARSVRAAIMLRTGKQFENGTPTRIVVYSHGMFDQQAGEFHSDSTLEIPEDGGCSGQAWLSRRPAFADLEKAAKNPAPWKMSPEQHRRIPAHRKSLLCVPIWNHPDAESDPHSVPLGTLSVDSETVPDDTDWIDDERTLRSEVVARLMLWENVIRKLFN